MTLRRSPHKKTFPRSCVSAAFVGLCALACGSADHTQIPPPDDDAGREAQVGSGVNVCPHFDGSVVLPQRIGRDESAYVAAMATDPDAANAQLVFSWTAASGVFTVQDKPMTSYRCSRVGPEDLLVTAKDRQGCSSHLTIPVECIEN